jgi:hypothetical protein
MSKLFKEWFSRIFILVSLIVIIYRLLIGYFNYREISEYQGETIGEIVEYYKVGVDKVFLKYSYEVDGKVLSRTVSVFFFSRINNCEKTQECIGRKFRVSYSKKNPWKSEIDLSKEIKDSPSGASVLCIDFFSQVN